MNDYTPSPVPSPSPKNSCSPVFSAKNLNIRGSLGENIPLKDFTTFKTGGPAALFARPEDEEDLKNLLVQLRQQNIPWFILGEGANILVSDKGIPGAVISMAHLNKVEETPVGLNFGAGLTISQAAEAAAERGLAGLEFFYAMPGSVGGALWMNARCYGGEISQIFQGATILNEKLEKEYINFKAEEWNYKKSPFQNRPCIILSGDFALHPGNRKELERKMEEIRLDRETKGHFKAPSGGSTFKNNRAFGAPSGKLIEDAGLKGLRLGGAAVSPWHGNILINENNARAADIDRLIRLVQEKVQKKTGFLLEAEVLKVGDWEDADAESD